MRIIDADALAREMYHKSFEVDNGRNVWNVWNSGLWVRYKIFEEAIRDAPIIDAIPISWIENFIDDIGDLEEEMTMRAVYSLLINEWRKEE